MVTERAPPVSASEEFDFRGNLTFDVRCSTWLGRARGPSRAVGYDHPALLTLTVRLGRDAEPYRKSPMTFYVRCSTFSVLAPIPVMGGSWYQSVFTERGGSP